MADREYIRPPQQSDFKEVSLPAYRYMQEVANQINTIYARTFLNVKDYGAAGDGVSNDTAAIQAAFDAAKSAKQMVFFPAGNYLVTASLDMTFTDNETAGIVVFGAGKKLTFIEGELAEEYPILDFTGNTRGELRGMTIRSDSATSKATAAFLSAKPALGGPRGNTVTVTDCMLEIPTSGNAFAVAGSVFYNTDLSKFFNSESYGPIGATFGATKPAGVVSKYQTVSAQVDSTLFTINESVFIGDSGPALEYTGGAAIHLKSVYAALIDTGSQSAFKISSPDPGYGNSVYADGFRTENQSSHVGMYAVEFDAKSSAGRLIGQLETDVAGSVIYINPAVTVSKYDINVLCTNPTAFFDGNAELHETTIKTNVGGIGSISASSSGNDFIGEISAASALAQSVKGVRIIKDSLHYMTMDLRLVSPGDPTKFFRPLGNYNTEGIGSSAYVGGSGEGLIYTFTVPGNVLDQTGMVTLGAIQFLLIGEAGGGSGLNGKIRVEASQTGAATTDILDTGASIPAGAGGIELTAKFINLSTTNALRSYCSLMIVNTPYQKYTNLQGASFVSTADITVRVYITNTGDDPYALNGIVVNTI